VLKKNVSYFFCFVLNANSALVKPPTYTSDDARIRRRKKKTMRRVEPHPRPPPAFSSPGSRTHLPQLLRITLKAGQAAAVFNSSSSCIHSIINSNSSSSSSIISCISSSNSSSINSCNTSKMSMRLVLFLYFFVLFLTFLADFSVYICPWRCLCEFITLAYRYLCPRMLKCDSH
jgi:hypothetical protein